MEGCLFCVVCRIRGPLNFLKFRWESWDTLEHKTKASNSEERHNPGGDRGTV
ncbi:hypothetical protein I79_000068 [Cricetulus griseus]|uniref:Uncharacterized protein n=1 Tax=Cricetulus griseus TaxID=10029 RepID=G3GRC5_CRIGR|nr:hypothetical protein I79_000068 [Cricetulus griseus]